MNFLKHKPNGNSAKKQWGRRGYPTLFTGSDFFLLSVVVSLKVGMHSSVKIKKYSCLYFNITFFVKIYFEIELLSQPSFNPNPNLN